jgi:hypothetical protein
MLVDPQIFLQIASFEFRKLNSIVQNGPQNPVGKSVVIFLVIFPGQIGDDVRGAGPLYSMRCDLVSRNDLAAPTELYAWVLLEGRCQSDFQAACAVSSAGGRRGDTVRDENQPRQYRSSQLRDRRIAVSINPANE